MKPSKLSTLLLALALTTAAHAQEAHWVGTWSTAPLQTTNAGAAVVLGAPAAPVVPAPGSTGIIRPPNNDPGITRPAPNVDPKMAINAAPQVVAPRPAPLGSTDITLRQTVHLSLGGSALRVVLTNEYGDESLTIGAASVAAQDPASSRPVLLTFGGKPGIVIPPNAIVLSDPISLKSASAGNGVASLSNIEINLFIPAQKITHLTRHTGALQTSYTEPGNTTAAPRSADASPIYSWTFLKSVDVLAPTFAGSVVCFGDSITDGAYATRDANARWPDDLAAKLAVMSNSKYMLGVLNEGIGGNRVLHDNTGPSALARFTRDALDQAGVKYIILLEAINDIGNAYRPTPAPRDVVTADDLIQGYQQLIARAHLKGIKVFGATLTPYNGASYNSPDGEKVRLAVNQWIRTSRAFDGVIDFDKATQDPAHPDTFLPAYDHGDHLHPTDAGLKAMADAIDLSLFTK